MNIEEAAELSIENCSDRMNRIRYIRTATGCSLQEAMSALDKALEKTEMYRVVVTTTSKSGEVFKVMTLKEVVSFEQDGKSKMFYHLNGDQTLIEAKSGYSFFFEKNS